MAILNSQGRLFRQWKLFDLGVALIIILIWASIFLFSGIFDSIAQADTSSKTIEVDVFIQDLNLRRPQALFTQGLKAGNQANIRIKNQPSGQMGIKSVKQIPITVVVSQPDGSVKELPDPRTKQLNTNIIVTLEGAAKMKDTGLVLGSREIKIGTPVEIEGSNYDLKAAVVDLRVK